MVRAHNIYKHILQSLTIKVINNYFPALAHATVAYLESKGC